MHGRCANEILTLLDGIPQGGREQQYQAVVRHCEEAIAAEKRALAEAAPKSKGFGKKKPETASS